MSDHKVTIRFRDNNADEMRAYEYISNENKKNNVSKNKIVISSLLRASCTTDNSYDSFVRDIVEGVARKLLDMGFAVSETHKIDNNDINFSNEDFDFMG